MEKYGKETTSAALKLCPNCCVGRMVVVTKWQRSHKFSQVDLTLDEVACLQEEGPTDQDVATVLEIEQRAHENGPQVEHVVREENSIIFSRTYCGMHANHRITKVCKITKVK